MNTSFNELNNLAQTFGVNEIDVSDAMKSYTEAAAIQKMLSEFLSIYN